MFNAGVIGSAPLTFQWFKDGHLWQEQIHPTGHIQCAGSRCRRLSNTGFKLFGISHQRRGDVDGAASQAVVCLATTSSGFGGRQQRGFCSLAVGSDDDLNPLRYTWYFQNNRIAGQTTANLLLSSITAMNQGAYDVVASNAYGMVTSAVAQLTVYLAFLVLKPDYPTRW